MGKPQNTVNCGIFVGPAAGGEAAPTERREPSGPWPDLSAYARQPARGPTMLAHLVANVGLCWPMLAYVGLMLTYVEPKDPKNENTKKHCNTQDILMVGSLSWGYVGPSWGYVGLS